MEPEVPGKRWGDNGEDLWNKKGDEKWGRGEGGRGMKEDTGKEGSIGW